jgi:hypothetical protein
MLHEDGRHSVLDLGSADGKRLRLLGRFARQIRFAGLLPRPASTDGWIAALESLPAHPAKPYDVVLAWDLLDRLPREHHRTVITRLAEVTADAARVYAIVDATGAPTMRPLAFTLADVDHISETEVGPPEHAGERLLPAHVERALRPFEVHRAFTLRSGFREYVAVKPL